MIILDGKEIGHYRGTCPPTDFSRVTARPEFVLNGKKFHDETGQLKEGTLAMQGNKPETVDSAAEMDAIIRSATSASAGSYYLYTGETTEKYTSGAVYVIEREA